MVAYLDQAKVTDFVGAPTAAQPKVLCPQLHTYGKLEGRSSRKPATVPERPLNRPREGDRGPRMKLLAGELTPPRPESGASMVLGAKSLFGPCRR